MKYKFIEKVLKELATQHSLASVKKEKSHLKAMITKCIRIVDDSCTIDRASRAAARVADGRGLDLSKMTWVNQTRFDPGRKLFVFEHKTPINTLVQQMIDSPDDPLSVLNDSEIVWITREEDATLNSLGYRKNRSDHDAAYKEAGIDIITLI
jgi:hypothetical protein